MSKTGQSLERLKELTCHLTSQPEREEAFQALLQIEERIIQCNVEARRDPIPMRLCCEACGKLHIDEGEFRTKVHHTHTCQHCGLTWRPAKEATVGVQWIPGFKNASAPDLAQSDHLGEGPMKNATQRLADLEARMAHPAWEAGCLPQRDERRK